MLVRAFWNVDTQYDFMNKDGKLYVPNAELIKPNLQKLTEYAKEKGHKVFNTGHWHVQEDREISDNPDFITTFSEHCMKNTKGAEFIPQTRPKNPYVIDCKKGVFDSVELRNHRNIVIRKNEFDVFRGNELTNDILNHVNPLEVVVYGVATNVCVDQAIMGHLKQGRRVYAVTDAMKELSNLEGKLSKDAVLDKWDNEGASLVKTKDILEGRV